MRIVSKFMLGVMLGITLASCTNDDAESDEGIKTELQTYQQQTNKKAREACGVTENTVADDDESEEARCYFELAVELDTCELEGLAAHEEEARALKQCWINSFDNMLDCCRSKNDLCTYSSIEDCYQTLWDGQFSGPCEVNTQAIDDTISACE